MNEPIIYNVVCRACFRSPDGQRFDMPVCFAIFDTNDKDLNDQQLFIAAVFNSLGIGGNDERMAETKDSEILCLEITTYSKDDMPYSEPLWMQAGHIYYFKNNQQIEFYPASTSDFAEYLDMIENTYTDKSLFNFYMVLSEKGYLKYDSLQAIRKDKRITDAQIFTYNRYMQLIEVGHKVGDMFYGTPFKTVAKLTLKEKLVSLERNQVANKYIRQYSVPSQMVVGIFLGVKIATMAIRGQISIFDTHSELTKAANKVENDHKLWRWLALFSTIFYAYIAYLIFR